MTKSGQGLLEEFRRQRRSGDPHLTESDKEILRRIAIGDLADGFALSLAAIGDADPLLGGDPATDPGPSGCLKSATVPTRPTGQADAP